MLTFIWIIVVIALLILTPIFVHKFIQFNFSSTNSQSCNDVVALTWKQVCDFYAVNPDRWNYTYIVEEGYNTLETSYNVLLYNTSNNPSWEKDFSIGHREFVQNNNIFRVRLLAPLDFAKFMYCLYIHNSKIQEMQDNKAMIKVLDTVSNDVIILREKAEKQITEANNSMKEIQRRMTNG